MYYRFTSLRHRLRSHFSICARQTVLLQLQRSGLHGSGTSRVGPSGQLLEASRLLAPCALLALSASHAHVPPLPLLMDEVIAF